MSLLQRDAQHPSGKVDGVGLLTKAHGIVLQARSIVFRILRRDEHTWEVPNPGVSNVSQVIVPFAHQMDT